MATYRNFSISKNKAKFYLREKQPTEGYEEVTYGEGKKTYHQYYKNVKGIPSYFGTKEIEYDGRKLKFLELAFEENDGFIDKISVNYRNKGGYTDEAKALISAMLGYKMGEPVSVSVSVKSTKGKNGKTYENLSIYVNYDNIKNEDGKNASTGYISYDDVPSPEKKEVAGETVWDFSKQTEFYYQKLQEIEARFGNNTPQATEAPAPAKEEKKSVLTPVSKEAEKQKAVIANPDLPF